MYSDFREQDLYIENNKFVNNKHHTLEFKWNDYNLYTAILLAVIARYFMLFIIHQRYRISDNPLR